MSLTPSVVPHPEPEKTIRPSQRFLGRSRVQAAAFQARLSTIVKAVDGISDLTLIEILAEDHLAGFSHRGQTSEAGPSVGSRIVSVRNP